MTTARSAYCLFCDDVRYEAGNKVSYMGVYSGEIALAAPSGATLGAQLVLPKLVIAFWLTSDIADKPSRALLTVYAPPDRTEIFKYELPLQPPQPTPDWVRKYFISGQMPFLNLPIKGNGFLEVTIDTERESFVVGRLRITVQAPAVADQGKASVSAAPIALPPPSEQSLAAAPGSERQPAPGRPRRRRIARTPVPE